MHRFSAQIVFLLVLGCAVHVHATEQVEGQNTPASRDNHSCVPSNSLPQDTSKKSSASKSQISRETINVYCTTLSPQSTSVTGSSQAEKKSDQKVESESANRTDWLSFWAKIVQALAWPTFGFWVIYAFKKQIGGLIDRLVEGEIFGQKFKLRDSLNQLNESANAAAAESVPVSDEKAAGEAKESDNEVQNILAESAKSPITALIRLSSTLEREANQLLASIGQINGRRNVSLSQGISELVEKCGLPAHISSSLKLFSEVRNSLIHKGDANSDNILRAIDSGITILKALNAVPREMHIVYHPGVDIYSDAQCTNSIKNGKGVILESLSPGGASKSFRIYPSTRIHFQKGKRVGWEWSFEHVWGAAWYKDPDNGEIKQGWLSSAEFIGRNLDEL